MSSSTLDTLTRAAPDGTWLVPEGWRQGRGAFGGLTLATLARAAGELPAASGRTLRTITAEIPGAVLAGRAALELTTLRAGTGLSTIAAQLEQGDETVAHAVLSFGKTRTADFERTDTEPMAVPPFAEVPVTPVTFGGPEFAQHVEYRMVRGAPLSGGREPRTDGWVRIKEPGEVPPWVALVALIDAWYPSAMPVITAPRPFGTISFAAHVFVRDWSLAEPLYHRSRLLGSQQGYFVELRELFTPRGELCAVNQQTMAIIR